MSEFRKGCWFVGIIMATIIVAVVAATEILLWLGPHNPRALEVLVIIACSTIAVSMCVCAWIGEK